MNRTGGNRNRMGRRNLWGFQTVFTILIVAAVVSVIAGIFGASGQAPEEIFFAVAAVLYLCFGVALVARFVTRR